MSKSSEAVKQWRKNTKLKLITCMGNKCQICNYNKSTNALEFHHLDPNEKDFSLGSIRANPKNWKSIVEELAKCILLCANCHREVHENITELPKEYQKFDESLLQLEENKHLLKQTQTTYCPVCNKQKENRNRFCSLSCAASTKQKVDWDSINLIDLIENQKIPKTKIAEMMHCSDQAVNKRYKKLKEL
jgi:hypothetical protein